MFGPDKCGHNYKLHFIFRHRDPVTGAFEEKHARKPDVDLQSYFTDKRPHLYTLSNVIFLTILTETKIAAREGRNS